MQATTKTKTVGIKFTHSLRYNYRLLKSRSVQRTVVGQARSKRTGHDASITVGLGDFQEASELSLKMGAMPVVRAHAASECDPLNERMAGVLCFFEGISQALLEFSPGRSPENSTPSERPLSFQ